MVFTCCCKCLKACQVLAGLAAGLHRGQAPVKGLQSQFTLVNASSHVETVRRTAQTIFTALACGSGTAHARHTLPHRCIHFTERATDEQVGMQECWVCKAFLVLGLTSSSQKYNTNEAELHVKDSCSIAHS